MKRAFDILASAIALVIALPFLAIAAILVRTQLGSPVFFRQKRPGLHGEVFEIVKFRTMTNETGTDGKPLPDSARLRPIGCFLRSTSLDELPELWNVLKGDMSLVGPRPLLVEYLPLYNDRQARRHDVRPGLTGLAQVSGRNAISWEERFELDVRYVENHTMLTDLSIILKTVKAVLSRKGINENSGTTMTPFTGTKS